jgi:hypothetical protein
MKIIYLHIYTRLSVWTKRNNPAIWLMNHNISSLFVAVLFSFMWFIPNTAIADAEPIRAEGGKSYALYAGASHRIPLLDTKNDWNSYTGGGLWLEMPSYTRRLKLRMGLEGGILSSMPVHGDMDVLIFHAMVSLLYDMPSIAKGIYIKPLGGISNTTVYIREKFELVNVDVFSSSENEFGFFFGAEPSYKKGRVIVSAPIYGEYVFSSPIPFVTATISARAGVAF